MELKRTCGSCTLCCKLLGIVELEKPAGKWCEHCDIGKGCKIYSDKPPTCSGFVCLWLAATPELIPDEYRPDLIRAVFWTPDESATRLAFRDRPEDSFPRPDVVVQEDTGFDAQKGKAGDLIKAALKAGKSVCIINGRNRRMLYPYESFSGR